MNTTQKALRSDKLGTMKIPKLLLSMSLPAMFSMLAYSFYNVIDSIFVAQYSPKALEAIAIAYPLQMLIIAFATGIGVGTNALVSKKLGERRNNEANLSAQTGLLLALLSYVLFILIAIFATVPFTKAFSTDAETVALGADYLYIVLGFSGFVFVEILLSKVFQATGNMKIPMMGQLTGALINIILDPILIFGLLGFPSMGVKGAAIATVTGQGVSMIIVICVFKFSTQDVSPFFNKKFRIRKDITKDILKVGAPSIVLKGLTSISVTFINFILRPFLYAISVLGIYIRLQSFIFMPVFGLTQGALPIMSYNYGANNKKRFSQTLKLSIFIAVGIMTVGTIVFQTMPHLLLKMFNAEDVFMDMGITAFRLISTSFIFAGFGIMITVMFQSLGNGFAALSMSLMRQLLLLMPLTALFAHFIGLNGIWLSFPIAEFLTIAVFLPFALYTIKKKFAEREIFCNEKVTNEKI